MGPHFFKCGNEAPFHAYSPQLFCFNGAALFQVRKCSHLATGRQSLACFNGAALFQVRKYDGDDHINDVAVSFNGAALFQVRKYPLSSLQEYLQVLLQWGRTFSSAEIASNLR